MGDLRLAKYQQFAVALNELFRPLEPQIDLKASTDGVLSDALLQLYRTIRIRVQISELLRRVIEKINAGKKFPEIFDYLFDSLGPVIRCDRMGIGLLEGGDTKVRLQWVRSVDAPGHLKVGYVAPLQGSSLQNVLTNNRPRIIDDLAAYLKNHPDSTSTQLALKDGIQSSLTCPLITNGKPVGFIFFSSMAPHTYGLMHIELFLGIAAELSLLIDQARVWRMFR